MSIASMQAYHKKGFESYVSYRRTGDYGPGESVMPDPDTAKHGVKPKGFPRHSIRASHGHTPHMHASLTGRVAQKADTGEL